MTSILDNRSIDQGRQIHICGGTILSGPDHVYCDRCPAIVYYGNDENCQTCEEAMTYIQNV